MKATLYIYFTFVKRDKRMHAIEGRNYWFKLIIGPLLFIITILMPPLSLIVDAAQVALGVLLWVASWWIQKLFLLIFQH